MGWQGGIGDRSRFPCRQVSDVSSLRARSSPTSREISRLLDRNKSISDGVNIRGPGEMPSLRMSAAVEGVTEVLLPPLFEAGSVFLFELMRRSVPQAAGQ